MSGVSIARAIEAAQNTAAALDRKHNLGYRLRNCVEDVRWYPGYADGRDAPKGIVAADWNDPCDYRDGRKELPGKIMSRLCAVLEKLGVEIEWSDQVSECDGCNLCIQTEPDCYSWTPEFVVGDGSITCLKCLLEDPSEYLEEIEGTTTPALAAIDLSEHGYERLEEGFENGWHPGQNDDPEKIAADLRKRGVEDFLFQVDEKGQFDVRFSVWAKKKDEEGVEELEEQAV